MEAIHLNPPAFGRNRSSQPLPQISPGARIRVKQRVTVGSRQWALEVSGVVKEVKRIPTGIHTDRARDDFWIDSVLLEKPDGELTRMTFDENTQVEVV